MNTHQLCNNAIFQILRLVQLLQPSHFQKLLCSLSTPLLLDTVKTDDEITILTFQILFCLHLLHFTTALLHCLHLKMPSILLIRHTCVICLRKQSVCESLRLIAVFYFYVHSVRFTFLTLPSCLLPPMSFVSQGQVADLMVPGSSNHTFVLSARY